MFTGYRTYLAILLAISPAIIEVIQTGLASGASWVTIGGGVLAVVFRYLATKA
jgi:hypothetical protein